MKILNDKNALYVTQTLDIYHITDVRIYVIFKESLFKRHFMPMFP